MNYLEGGNCLHFHLIKEKNRAKLPLGWMLSKDSTEEMQRQLNEPALLNHRNIGCIKKIFEVPGFSNARCERN